MFSVHRVQRDVGAVAKSVCQSGCHHSSVQGQTQCRPAEQGSHSQKYSVSRELDDRNRCSVSSRNSLPSAR